MCGTKLFWKHCDLHIAGHKQLYCPQVTSCEALLEPINDDLTEEVCLECPAIDNNDKHKPAVSESDQVTRNATKRKSFKEWEKKASELSRAIKSSWDNRAIKPSRDTQDSTDPGSYPSYGGQSWATQGSTDPGSYGGQSWATQGSTDTGSYPSYGGQSWATQGSTDPGSYPSYGGQSGAVGQSWATQGSTDSGSYPSYGGQSWATQGSTDPGSYPSYPEQSETTDENYQY
ncbi:hypothetical protein B0T17DRAFT_137077 [Bombardia bombarda]|uniref:Uncharacterized protein n=1 Tax=Bombardia bombarda TaxID=252184 RepID=A0AA39TVB9_9PEZI|nr:hypothetical protein B0T17DRAFT_137077 [Bombardia bombarda]